MQINSKLPQVGATIFSVMSALANEHGAINLSQGFPNFDCAEELKSLVAQYMSEGHNQYAPMTGLPALRYQISQKFNRLYGIHIDSDKEITMTAGATQALFTAITTFVKAGDEVILIEPAYDSYRPAIEVNGGHPVSYELNAPDYQIDWQRLRRLVTAKTRMIIINTPQNPIGKVWKEHDFKELEKLVQGTDMLVLSDEVYEHLVFDGLKHHTVLSFPNLRERSIATYSFGKTFHVTGWKMGYCVAAPNLMKEFRKVHQYQIFSVNTPIQHALAAFLEKPEEYLGLASFFQNKRDLLLNLLKDSRLMPIHSEGTYFQLVDYSRISSEPDTEFAKRMTVEYGVASIPVSVFYSSKKDDKVIRLCFAKTEGLLEQAGHLLQKI